MFEKLKEYALYIILWLIALWALAYAYLQTSNSQKWAEIESANLDAMTVAMSKSDKLKKNSTVAEDLLNANWWKTIWKYKIDSNKVSYVIWETYNSIFDNKKMLDISSDVADIEDWQLRTILIAQPATKVNGEDINTVHLNNDKSLTVWSNTISHENLNEVADELKWYNVWAIGYTTFATEQEAKDFRDTYFSSYEIYEIWETWTFAILKEYNDWLWDTNIEEKIDTTSNIEWLWWSTWWSETWDTEEVVLLWSWHNMFSELTLHWQTTVIDEWNKWRVEVTLIDVWWIHSINFEKEIVWFDVEFTYLSNKWQEWAPDYRGYERVWFWFWPNDTVRRESWCRWWSSWCQNLANRYEFSSNSIERRDWARNTWDMKVWKFTNDTETRETLIEVNKSQHVAVINFTWTLSPEDWKWHITWTSTSWETLEYVFEPDYEFHTMFFRWWKWRPWEVWQFNSAKIYLKS